MTRIVDGFVDDGFGGQWVMCGREDCDLHVVRPGKVQCSGEQDDIGCVWGDLSAAMELAEPPEALDHGDCGLDCECWWRGWDAAEEAEQESLRANSTELRRACDELREALDEWGTLANRYAEPVGPADRMSDSARRLLALCATRAPLPGEGRG